MDHPVDNISYIFVDNYFDRKNQNEQLLKVRDY